jgi:hypothetical protein
MAADAPPSAIRARPATKYLTVRNNNNARLLGRGTLAVNEALAFSSIDIEVAGFVIWEATSGRKFLLSLRPPHSRQACEPGCASKKDMEFP